MRSFRLSLGLPLAALLAVPAVRAVLASDEAEAADTTQIETKSSAPNLRIALEDRALQPFQVELLELAFETASALPLEPHHKNRSRLQDRVASTCLELEQPHRALRYVEVIAGWRRGTALADVGLFCAQHEDAAAARALIELARDCADHLEGEEVQDWHRERILAKAATAEAALSPAQPIEAGSDAFDEEWAALGAAMESEVFDELRAALGACAGLIDRNWSDAERCKQIEARMREIWMPMPALVRAELLMLLAGVGLEHGDSAAALAWLDEMPELLAQMRPMPELLVPLLARWGGLRHRAGDSAGAQRAAEEAWTTYVETRERMFDIDRADALLPLAETCNALGDRPRALELYALALEECVHNPNSRPRAEDLTAACLSLAKAGVEPDEKLRERLIEVRAKLGDPW